MVGLFARLAAFPAYGRLRSSLLLRAWLGGTGAKAGDAEATIVNSSYLISSTVKTTKQFFRSRVAECALLPRLDGSRADPAGELSIWSYRALISGGQRQQIAGLYGIDTHDFHSSQRQDQRST